MTLRRRALLLAVLPAAGCATRAPRPAADDTAPVAHWSGRLALQVDETPQPQSFFAAFDLQGGPVQGQLELFSPLGSTLARLEWAPGRAVLHDDHGKRAFNSVEDLLQNTTGAALPIAALFQWLDGQSTPVPGWEPDLRQLGEGQLIARRTQPLPTAMLRIVLDR